MGFVYVAIILDAWSTRVVGYAVVRRIDPRLTLAALMGRGVAANPPPGCIHHSDRDGQHAADLYRQALADLGLRGSKGRRGNPYDNAKAESLMKSSSVSRSISTNYRTFTEDGQGLPEFIDQVYNTRRLHPARGYLPPVQFEGPTWPATSTISGL